MENFRWEVRKVHFTLVAEPRKDAIANATTPTALILSLPPLPPSLVDSPRPCDKACCLQGGGGQNPEVTANGANVLSFEAILLIVAFLADLLAFA